MVGEHLVGFPGFPGFPGWRRYICLLDSDLLISDDYILTLEQATMNINFVPKTVDIFAINTFTLREIILFIAYHLVRQNKAARNYEGFCQFKIGDGTKCAVGFCIPNERYQPKFESDSVVSSFVKIFGIDITPDRLDVLIAFQAIHDQNRDTKMWKYLIIEKFQSYFDDLSELKEAIKAGIAARARKD